ncbi:MAG TPA: hypothetical protein VFM23_07390 [Gemmatimonadales bacterium]|nr:hypothetical protein [Gemmatimonadales bacterium]
MLRYLAWHGAAALLLVSGAAWAGPEVGVQAFGTPVTASALESHRAGDGKVVFNMQETSANLQDNQAVNTTSGSNTISGEAFRGASGFPVAVQNSGNNVIIQNGFIVNLEMQ